jgi:pimeloyl-ACP methyl ester carboxylesterase
MLGRSPEKAAAVKKRYMEQLSYRGYKAALRSTLLHMPMSGMEAAYRRVGAQARPCALFWGTADTVVPYALHAAVIAALPGVAFHSIDGGSHAVNFEEPDRINAELVAFLRAES